ncbi:hypothetical protein AMECASPLE_030959 [Ameca splendens]|uniref:Uncharacterized protein n=1 Tax=Ameca splendens TaxID=208324 RepID=A0ABV0ZFN1_9TELE
MVSFFPHSGKASGVDEICLKYLKSMDGLGLSWPLTRLFNIAWRSVGSVSELVEQGCGPHAQDGGPEGVFQIQRDHTPQPLWEGLCQSIGEDSPADSRISASGGTVWFLFHPWNTIPDLHLLQGARWFMGVFPTSPHVFLWTCRRHSTMSLVVPFGEHSRSTESGAFY